MSAATEAHEPAEEHRGRIRSSLRVPGVLLRIVKRDPTHVPERLTIYSVDRGAKAAAEWARRAREAAPDTPPAVLVEEQRRRTVSTARINGAVAGTPFFVALVPAYLTFLSQELRLHLRTAAIYGHDPADPRVSAEFLVLRGVRKDVDEALRALDEVRATPLPPAGARTPLRTWYQAVMGILVLAGFMAPPEEGERVQLSLGAKTWRAVRFIVGGLIWIMTWVVPVTFMIVMSWSCESDARRFGHRVAAYYADEGDDILVAMARADRRTGGNRMVTAARTVLVGLSVLLPLAVMASALTPGRGPLGLDLPTSAGALAGVALVIGVTIAALRS